MIHPSENHPARPRAVRDGQHGPVVCASCGCRLEAVDEGSYVHFGRFAGRDARGCRVACVDVTHDGHGRPAGVLTA